MLSVLLTHDGFDVVCIYSAAAALDAAQKQQFDVILSDIGMPQMSGYELAHALRALPGYERVPYFCHRVARETGARVRHL